MYLIDDNAQDAGAVAVVDAATERSLSYGDLGEAVGREGARLTAVGGGLGFCFASNGLDTVVSYLAAVEAGIPVLLLDAAMREAPRLRLIEHYQPDFLLAPPSLAAPAGYGRGPDAALGLELWLRAGGERTAVHPLLALLLPTSGSTGSPKLVRLSRRNLEANAASIAAALRLDAGERAITSLPLFYSYGLSVLNSHLVAGARVVVSDEAVVQRGFWESFRRNSCSSFAGVPYTYQLLRRMRFERMDLPSLTSMTQAGGRLERDMVLWFHHHLRERGAALHVMYGQTEATARIACLPPEELPARAASVGVAIPGGTLEIRDRAGRSIPPGYSGELFYRGPNVMMGYATTRQDLARGDDLHGELATGDQAYLDDDGFLHITGRNRRFAKLMGLRVNLAEVEAALAAPAPAAVVAVDERLVVFVEAASREDLERCRQRLVAEVSLDPQVVEMRSVDALPLAANGKVDYRELERWS